MQRGRYLNLAALAGALALAAGMASAAPPPPAPTAAAPVGIFTGDVGLSDGANMGSGSITVSGTGTSAVYTVTAIGEDIQGKADRGYFAYTNLPGDGGITARVLTQTGGSTGGWAKNGVMIRQSPDPGSVMVTLNYTSAGKNHKNPELEFLTRTKAATGPSGFGSPGDLKNGPIWLRAQRQGQNYQVLASTNGKDWSVIAQQTLSIKATDPVLAGLSASSQSKTVAEMATLDNVSVSSEIVQPNPPPVPGRVEAFPGTGAVLVMFPTVANAVGYNIYRQEAGSKNAAVKVNTDPTPYGWYIDSTVTNGTHYLYSVTAVTKSLADPSKVLEGPASPQAQQAVVTPQMPIAPGFWVYDIGTIFPSTVAINGNVLSVHASGHDFWDYYDSGTIISMPVAGDFSIQTELLAKPVSNNPKQGYVKAGLNIRESLDPSARSAIVWASQGQGVSFEDRRTVASAQPDNKTFPGRAGQGGTSDKTTKYPLWLRMTKIGTMFHGYQSNDGSTWTELGKPVDFDRVEPANIWYAGLFVTAHDDNGDVLFGSVPAKPEYADAMFALDQTGIGPPKL